MKPSKMSIALFKMVNKTDDGYDFAECEDCSWTGKPSECKTDYEQDDYESPIYPIAFCPMCGEPSVIFCKLKGGAE